MLLLTLFYLYDVIAHEFYPNHSSLMQEGIEVRTIFGIFHSMHLNACTSANYFCRLQIGKLKPHPLYTVYNIINIIQGELSSLFSLAFNEREPRSDRQFSKKLRQIRGYQVIMRIKPVMSKFSIRMITPLQNLLPYDFPYIKPTCYRIQSTVAHYFWAYLKS